MNEFEIIERFFAPLTMGQTGSAGLKNDAAVVCVPEGYELVVTSDTLNEGIHFLSGTNPEYIAKKALRANLSDLAAMGAEPLCYQLNLAFPEKPDLGWLSTFSNSFLEDNREFNIYCSGGDTTRIGGDDLSVSITAIGVVPKGKAVRRSGAKDGDCIIITGGIGDAVLGLKCLQAAMEEYDYAVSRYLVPQPRCDIVKALRQYANAATDISDGLLADLCHIAQASGLGVALDFDENPFSSDVQFAMQDGIISFDEAVKGGDDYELVFAVSPENVPLVFDALKTKGLSPFCLGVFTSEVTDLVLSDKDQERISDTDSGWVHF